MLPAERRSRGGEALRSRCAAQLPGDLTALTIESAHRIEVAGTDDDAVTVEPREFRWTRSQVSKR
jgi:hypothetical protein